MTAPGSMLDLLACPVCRGRLEPVRDGLVCMVCAQHFECVRGVPVLFPEPTPVTVMPAEHTSFALPPELIERLSALDGWWLHVGAGASPEKIPNCIEFELNVFRNTSLIGDIHRLPFVPDAFQAIVAFNVFEHLPDPPQAAAELHRVLAPGGEVVIQTAFLQPLHADPGHYYNTTEMGLRRWFGQYDVLGVEVTPNFEPTYSLAWFASDLLYLAGELSPDDVDVLASSTLGEWAELWREPAARSGRLWEAMAKLPDHAKRRLAAGFQLRGRKATQG
ncbi:MAG: methyltransferase domain-containing protein [Acidimicrobiia bacterium]|nr:methyltransferase domain-containing protein [Acidimicrobiia bacterium]